LRRSLLIIVLFMLSALLWWVYDSSRLPPGVEAKGGPEVWIPWVSLVGSIISLITGLVTLSLKIIEIRQKGKV
jgi:hypothetical protein